MKFNVSLSDCEKSIAINATLVAFSAVVVVVSASCFSIYTAIMAAIILVYGAVKLDRAVIIKKDVVANGELTTAVLLKEAKKNIGASAYLMASSAIMMTFSLSFISSLWLYGIVYLIVFIYTAIELSVAVSLNNEYIKGNRGDEKTQQAINGCVEKILGGGAAMLALTACFMIYHIYSVISVAMLLATKQFDVEMFLGIGQYELVLMSNLSLTLFVFALFCIFGSESGNGRQSKEKLCSPSEGTSRGPRGFGRSARRIGRVIQFDKRKTANLGGFFVGIFGGSGWKKQCFCGHSMTRYIVSADCFVCFSLTSSTSKRRVLLPKDTVTTSPILTSFEGFATFPFISIRPPSQASAATERRFITLETFKNLSILILFSPFGKIFLSYFAEKSGVYCAHF